MCEHPLKGIWYFYSNYSNTVFYTPLVLPEVRFLTRLQLFDLFVYSFVHSLADIACAAAVVHAAAGRRRRAARTRLFNV